MIVRKLDFYIRAVAKFVCFGSLKALAYVWPRNSESVVMGGWSGELFIDNPKYLLLYMLEHTDFKITWIGNDGLRRQLPQNEKLGFARKGSFAAFVKLINAKTWICCQAVSMDLTEFPILGRAQSIDLWHGIPIKYVGELTPSLRSAKVKSSLCRKIYQAVVTNSHSWLVVSNDKMIDILCDGAPSRYVRSKILRVGTPRNDFLLNNASNKWAISSLRQKYSTLLGFDKRKKIVLYLPTWRMNGDVFAFYKLSNQEQSVWHRALDDANAVLIEKHHRETYKNYPTAKSSHCSIVISSEMQKEIDVQELLLVADVLISDYSGAYIDFGLLKKPVVHFAYDLDTYKSSDSGLAYDLQDVAAGPIVTNYEELLHLATETLRKLKCQQGSNYLSLVQYENGEASKAICDFMMTTRR